MEELADALSEVAVVLKCCGKVMTSGRRSRRCVGRSQIRKVSGRRPVIIEARDGLQTACWQYARVKSRPRLARASTCGLITCFAPMQPSSDRRSSAMMKSTLGRFCGADHKVIAPQTHAKTKRYACAKLCHCAGVIANHIVFSVSFGYRNPTDMSGGGNEPTDLQKRVHEIIFEADTPAGKQFDVLLIICILLSVGATMIETIPGYPNQRDLLNTLEWAFTIGFAEIFCPPLV